MTLQPPGPAMKYRQRLVITSDPTFKDGSAFVVLLDQPIVELLRIWFSPSDDPVKPSTRMVVRYPNNTACQIEGWIGAGDSALFVPTPELGEEMARSSIEVECEPWDCEAKLGIAYKVLGGQTYMKTVGVLVNVLPNGFHEERLRTLPVSNPIELNRRSFRAWSDHKLSWLRWYWGGPGGDWSIREPLLTRWQAFESNREHFVKRRVV